MGKHYVPKKGRVQGSAVITALAKVASKEMTMVDAAYSVGLDRSTLYKYKRGHDIPAFVRQGCKPIFTRKQEELIETWAYWRCRSFNGVTKKELKDMAFKLAAKNGIPHPFKNNLAGDAWVDGFLMRRPNLRIKVAEQISAARALSFTKQAVDEFFDNLEKLLATHQFSPTFIFNVDECARGIVRDGKLKCISHRFVRKNYRIKSRERSPLVTMICCCSAEGFYIPPAFVFPSKKDRPNAAGEGPNGAVSFFTDNGWSNGLVFLNWLRHFVQFLPRHLKEPVLLILDGHVSHKNLDVLSYCVEQNIHVLTLPPHSSHRMQPLDLSFFGPLKGRFEKNLDNLRVRNSNLSIWEIPRIVRKPYEDSATVKNAEAGFRKSGIWVKELGSPSRDAYSAQDFMYVDSEEIPPDFAA